MTEQNNECNIRDQPSNVVLKKLLCVKYLRRHVIDKPSRDLQDSNCARVSIKPGRATGSKRQHSKLSKNQQQNCDALLPSSSLTLEAVLPQHKGGQSISGLSTYRQTVTTPRGVL